MSTPLDASVNLFRGVLATTPARVLTLAEALALIQNGTYRQDIHRLQHLLATEGEARYKAAKTQLDAVTFCGTFHPTRSKDTLTQHSGIVHGDLDHLTDAHAIKAQLCADPHTLYCFQSPSGSGLKVGLPVTLCPDDAAYKLAWQAAADYHDSRYGITWDASGKDVSRLCFLSNDPDVYVNTDATPLLVPAAVPTSSPPPATQRPVLPPLTLDDTALIHKALHAANGSKFAALWSGDASGYASQSEADAALCCLLAWWTRHNTARVDRLFRQSGLYATIQRHGNPEDYLQRTIATAMAAVTEDYTPAKRAGGTRARAPLSGKGPRSQAPPVPDMTQEEQLPATGDAPAEQPLDATAAAQRAAAALLAVLSTCADDAKEDAVLDALPNLISLDMLAWMRLKRQLKVVIPTLNRNDLDRARKDLQRAAAQARALQGYGTSESETSAMLAEEFHAILAYDVSRQGWMNYDNGLWTPLATERVTQRIITRMDAHVGRYAHHALSGVEHLLRTRLAHTIPLATPGWLPFRNGALHLDTMAFALHSPDRPFTWQLPYDYNAAATCPLTLDWLHATVGQAHNQVQVLRAYAKAVVTGRVNLERYLETLGPAGTGKGTYTRLLTALVGVENTVATELKHLEANRFELSSLRGKRLMVVTDAERYGGPVNQLKAITGEDFVRMEEKFKAQRTETAPVMVVISANEPIQSADYTSGLVRRRLSVPFRYKPSTPRDLLSWNHEAGAWHGELAAEIPGVLNWVLALPDTAMEALLKRTTETVPSLTHAWALSLVETNPLAEWANQALILDSRTEAQGAPPAGVNVGRAHKIDRTNDYEHQDTWLYPNYCVWMDDTGGKRLSSRRFTGLLKDLFENQLRLDGVTHTDNNKGSQFFGIRLRTHKDADQPLFITKNSPPILDKTHTVTSQPLGSDGCDACDIFLQSLYQTLLPPPSPPPSDGTLPVRVGRPYRGEIESVKTRHQASHPSLVRENASSDMSRAATEPPIVDISSVALCPRCGALDMSPAWTSTGQPACSGCSVLTDAALTRSPRQAWLDELDEIDAVPAPPAPGREVFDL